MNMAPAVCNNQADAINKPPLPKKKIVKMWGPRRKRATTKEMSPVQKGLFRVKSLALRSRRNSSREYAVCTAVYQQRNKMKRKKNTKQKEAESITKKNIKKNLKWQKKKFLKEKEEEEERSCNKNASNVPPPQDPLSDRRTKALEVTAGNPAELHTRVHVLHSCITRPSTGNPFPPPPKPQREHTSHSQHTCAGKYTKTI